MMRHDRGPLDPPVALASATTAGAGAGEGSATVPLSRLGTPGGLRLPRVRIGEHPLAGRIALGSLLLGLLATVVFARSGPSALVPRSGLVFPPWESGPLHHIFGHIANNWNAMSFGFSGVVVAMTLAYGVVLASARTLSMRTVAICVVALHAIVLLSPPLQLTDAFNYLGYARLGGLHHLNPYTHVIAQEEHDPIFHFATWLNLPSPYGPLFTAMTYPLSWLSIPAAYWVLKSVTLLASLGFIALVWQCARQLGRDPRFPVLFVAANPIFLMYALPGFHNDFLMLVPSMGAISLLLARRDRSAGAVLMLAVAIKFTAVLLLPFLLLAARPAVRRRQVVIGAVLGAIPIIALSLALFGPALPNLSDQSTLLTDFAIPNVFGLIIGVGGAAPGLLRVANVALVAAVALLLWRRPRDWIGSAGWATIALIASLAWLVPWYVVWVLPLAALANSAWLRRAALLLTVYLVFAFIPWTGIFLANHNLNLLSSPVGQASRTLQLKLAK